jgi:hypothetical protein
MRHSGGGEVDPQPSSMAIRFRRQRLSRLSKLIPRLSAQISAIQDVSRYSCARFADRVSEYGAPSIVRNHMEKDSNRVAEVAEAPGMNSPT